MFVVISGVADEPCQSLGQVTPLQAARTPNLDDIARKSEIGYCYAIKEGIAPQSSDALVSLFGQNPSMSSRAALEAAGFGIGFKRGDLVVRTNFATVDDLKSKNILDRRAGRTLTKKEAKILAKEVNQGVKLPFKFEFVPTLHHRGILLFRGGFSDNITNTDPFYGNGLSHNGREGLKAKFSEPMDDDENSKLSANLVNSFMRQSHEILDKHSLNSLRVRKGLFSANCLLCRDAGSAPVRFKKLKGRWMALGYTPLERGVALALKMDLYNVKYPAMKSMDIYSNLYSGLNRALKSSIKMMKRNVKKQDYFYIHLKETEVPGMDNKPADKVKMIELIDKKLFGFLKKFAKKQGAKIVITSDRVASSRMKSTTAGPVPVLYYNPADELNEEKRFTEEQALKGKRIIGNKLLENTLLVK